MKQALTTKESNEQLVATVNVRMPASLKIDGEVVLEREGVSVTTAVRRLYAYLDKNQTLPSCLLDPEEGDGDELIAGKRKILENLVGILPHDLSLEKIRDERLSKHLRQGIQ